MLHGQTKLSTPFVLATTDSHALANTLVQTIGTSTSIVADHVPLVDTSASTVTEHVPTADTSDLIVTEPVPSVDLIVTKPVPSIVIEHVPSVDVSSSTVQMPDDKQATPTLTSLRDIFQWPKFYLDKLNDVNITDRDVANKFAEVGTWSDAFAGVSADVVAINMIDAELLRRQHWVSDNSPRLQHCCLCVN